MHKFFLSFALLLMACTSDADARRSLDNLGFTDIVLDGYSWFGCSESDQTHTAFHAKNAQGHPVTGVVCCGLTKACTVRF